MSRHEWNVDIIRRILVTFVRYLVCKNDPLRLTALKQVLADHDKVIRTGILPGSKVA